MSQFSQTPSTDAVEDNRVARLECASDLLSLLSALLDASLRLDQMAAVSLVKRLAQCDLQENLFNPMSTLLHTGYPLVSAPGGDPFSVDLQPNATTAVAAAHGSRYGVLLSLLCTQTAAFAHSLASSSRSRVRREPVAGVVSKLSRLSLHSIDALLDRFSAVRFSSANISDVFLFLDA